MLKAAPNDMYESSRQLLYKLG